MQRGNLVLHASSINFEYKAIAFLVGVVMVNPQ